MFCESLATLYGDRSNVGSIIQQHTFAEGIPKTGGENARINLWLINGTHPKHDKTIEIIIEKFEFVPPANETAD